MIAASFDTKLPVDRIPDVRADRACVSAHPLRAPVRRYRPGWLMGAQPIFANSSHRARLRRRRRPSRVSFGALSGLMKCVDSTRTSDRSLDHSSHCSSAPSRIVAAMRAAIELISNRFRRGTNWRWLTFDTPTVRASKLRVHCCISPLDDPSTVPPWRSILKTRRGGDHDGASSRSNRDSRLNRWKSVGAGQTWANARTRCERHRLRQRRCFANVNLTRYWTPSVYEIAEGLDTP